MSDKTLAERAQEHIRQKWVRRIGGPDCNIDTVVSRACPMCGHAEFEAGNTLVGLHTGGSAGFDIFPLAPTIKVFPMTCTHCGFMLLLDAKVAGLLPENVEAPT